MQFVGVLIDWYLMPTLAIFQLYCGIVGVNFTSYLLRVFLFLKNINRKHYYFIFDKFKYNINAIQQYCLKKE
jgi:hypothetical protein